MKLPLLLTFFALLAPACGSLTYVRNKLNGFSTDPASALWGHTKSLVGGNPTTFKKLKTSANGVSKWQQMLNNVAIYGATVATHHDKKGRITRIEGSVAQKVTGTPLPPLISKAEALLEAKKYWGHDKLRKKATIRDYDTEMFYYDADPTESPKKNGLWPIYRVRYAVMPRSRDVDPAYITALEDATNGKILRTWNGADAKVKGAVGNSKIGKMDAYMDLVKEGKRCYHRHDEKRILTIDLRGSTDYNSPRGRSNFRCSRADEDNFDGQRQSGGYSPRNEAYHFANHFYDMWYDLIGPDVPPHETNTSWLYFYVHYSSYYENAFFNGEAFTFGDGASTFYPLTSLDIVCHEVGHAITQWHGADLEYSRQSGGMNEAYSDIIGEACDQYFTDKSNFLIGEDVMRNNRALRDMCDPTSLGSVDHFSNYNDGLDVHYSSGIYNKAYCILSQSNGYDYKKAFKAFTLANLYYWRPTDTMHCGACGVLSAAEDLGYRLNPVRSAFARVGVYCRC